MKIRILLGVSLLAAVPFGMAGVATDSMTVSASVIDACTVSSGSLAFGSFSALDNANVDATATITVTCSNGTAYSVGLDLGANESGIQRRMSDGTTNYLNYGIYSDASHTSAWGDTIGTDTVGGTGNGSGASLTAYGRIPSGQQTAVVGSYSDTVAVTVTY